MAAKRKPRTGTKCPCGCGQAPAETTRLRKASCGCGESIIRLSRAALLTVNATCIACGGPLEPDCLLDRAGTGDVDAIGELERKYDAAIDRRTPKSTGRTADRYHCGCGALRSPDAKRRLRTPLFVPTRRC